MSETTTLAAVLRKHEADVDSSFECWGCGWRNSGWLDEENPKTYTDHVADVVLDHLAAKASEAAVVEAVALLMPTAHGITARVAARDALTAFLGALQEATDGPEKPRTAPESDRGGLSDHLGDRDDEESAR